MKKTLKSKDQLFKWSLASVYQNYFQSHFHFAQLFYLNTIYREQFHDNIWRRLVKYLSS